MTHTDGQRYVDLVTSILTV